MPVFKSSRKVQVFGSSLAMTLPAMFAKACEIKQGQELNVYYGLDGVLVLSSCEDEDSMREMTEKILKDMARKSSSLEND
jgi:antitoxin component of MazEF toxin-antitoxin module